MRTFLVIVDRDGTLITNDDFFGKEADWQQKIQFNKFVVDFLAYLKTKYHCTMIVVTNQQGVARGYFPETRVTAINHVLAEHLKSQGVTIKSWLYCPDVDENYAREHPKINWLSKYVKSQTKRKPHVTMVMDALRELKTGITQFTDILTIGDREDDLLLAKNLKAYFLDVRKHKSLKALVRLSEQLLHRQ